MYDSHRHGYLTLGWIATIVGVLVFFAVLESKYSTAQKSAEYAYKCAEQYQRKTSPSSDVATTPGNVEEADSAEENQSDPNWCDLAAQQSMAESTYAMNIAAWATVIFTGVGAFLIWRTLLATQDAVFETRRIGEAQTRAYVTVNGGEMKWGNLARAIPQTIVSVENTGQTPAIWFSVKAAAFNARAGDGEAEFSAIDFSTAWPKRWNALGPKSTLTVPIAAERIQEIMREANDSDGALVFNVAGTVQYETIFGEVYESEFWFARRNLPGYAREPTEQVGNMTRWVEVPHRLQRRTCVIQSYRKIDD